MILSSLVLLVLTATAYGSLFTDHSWNGLRADDSFRGYGMANSVYGHGVVLLYDVNGYIAGVQAWIPSGLPHLYPPPSLQPPFIEKGNVSILTVYFVHPSIICTTGRTKEDFKRDGTGTNLYLQIGPNPEMDVALIPRKQSDLANTGWTEGQCVPTIGRHYWFNTNEDTSCDNILPLFLTYNGGKLTGFGWGFAAKIRDKFMQHPPRRAMGHFIKDPPTCLKERDVTALHFFLTDSVIFNFC